MGGFEVILNNNCEVNFFDFIERNFVSKKVIKSPSLVKSRSFKYSSSDNYTETGKVYSNNFQPLCFIPLPINNKEDCSIYDCIDLYLEKETLESHRINDEGETREVYKQMKLFRLPKIIIFTI